MGYTYTYPNYADLNYADPAAMVGLFIVFFIVTGIFILCAAWFTTMLGLWTYHDAKVRSDNATMWTLIVVLTSYIGLIIYLAAGRKKSEKSPGKFKKLMIASLVCYIVSFIAYMIVIFGFVFYSTMAAM